MLDFGFNKDAKIAATGTPWLSARFRNLTEKFRRM